MNRALLIGINYINDPQATLRGCIDDIVNMENILTSKYGYSSDNIIMLRDDISDPTLQPTRDNILSQLQKLATISTANDNVWIHYSGHGSLIQNSERGMLVPVDYDVNGFIKDTDFFAIIQQMLGQTVIVMDSCNSGSVCDLEWNYEYLYGLNFMRTQLNNQFILNSNIFVLSGCKTLQNSAEIFDIEANQYEGAFTDALLHVMKSNSYTISLGKLMQGICAWLVSNGISTQKPMLSSSSASPILMLSPPSELTSSVIQQNFQNIIGTI